MLNDATFGSLHRTALSLVKDNQTLNTGVTNERLAAACNHKYLEQVLLA